MAHVSIKINGACLVSGWVNSPIQFPPKAQLHRQWLEWMCKSVCCVWAFIISWDHTTRASFGKIDITAFMKLLSWAVSELYIFSCAQLSFHALQKRHTLGHILQSLQKLILAYSLSNALNNRENHTSLSAFCICFLDNETHLISSKLHRKQTALFSTSTSTS